MAAFLGRLFKTFVEDVLVQRISDSHHVQRMAVRAVETGRDAHKALQNPEGVKQFAADVFAELQRLANKDLAAAPPPSASAPASASPPRGPRETLK